MAMQNEAVKIGLTYILKVLELNAVMSEKNNAVRTQNFEEAVILRDKEKKLRSEMPTEDDIKKIIEKL